jgi:pimeloyl-ACP methyl ester carboxylesterase
MEPSVTRENNTVVSLDGINIRLHRVGSGPTIVLLHGLGSTHREWDGLASLSQRFELVSYDLPGHGETAAPDSPYEIEDLSQQLEAVLTEADIVRAHLAGSSLGGMIAQHFAATYPDRVDRLVLCDTSPALSEGTRDELLTIQGSGPAHEAMARADLMDLAEEIYAPTLVLCGDGAGLAMREGADFLARSIPSGQLAFVPRTTMSAVAEQPAWVARVLLDFLGRA